MTAKVLHGIRFTSVRCNSCPLNGAPAWLLVALRGREAPQHPHPDPKALHTWELSMAPARMPADGNRVSRRYFLYFNHSHTVATRPRPALCVVDRLRRLWKHQKGTKNIPALQLQGLRWALVALAGGRSTWDE